MYDHYYHHLRLAEERTQEGLRKAAVAQHARAANSERGQGKRSFRGLLASLLSRLVRRSAAAPGRVPVRAEADQSLAQSHS